MRVDGSLAMLDRWGRAALPGAVLLFFVLLALAPLRRPAPSPPGRGSADMGII